MNSPIREFNKALRCEQNARLNATWHSGPFLRIEPIDSVNGVVRLHIGGNPCESITINQFEVEKVIEGLRYVFGLDKHLRDGEGQ